MGGKDNNLERLRDKLNKIADLGNLSEQTIIALSEELDAEIIKYYKEPRKPQQKIYLGSRGADGQSLKE